MLARMLMMLMVMLATLHADTLFTALGFPAPQRPQTACFTVSPPHC